MKKKKNVPKKLELFDFRRERNPKRKQKEKELERNRVKKRFFFVNNRRKTGTRNYFYF